MSNEKTQNSEPEELGFFGQVIPSFLFFSLGIGLMYWAVLAWKVGSWLMFASLILFPFAALMGFWSLVFGTPEWVYYIFY